MVNANLLKSKIVLHGENMTILAECLGITRQTLTSKVTGVTDFTQSEIKEIILRYGLTSEETTAIFFGESDESDES